MQRINALATRLCRSAGTKNEGKVPKIDNIRKGWDAYAEEYANNAEFDVLPAQLAMANELAFKSNENILEVACGSGLYASHFLRTDLKKYAMVDLSPNMVKLAKKRMIAKLRMMKGMKEGRFIKEGEVSEEDLFREFKVEISEANAENFSNIPSDSVDVYFGGLFMHLVPDPKLILKEAFRVVKPGGRIGFSVFGEENKGLFFTLFDNLVLREGKIDFRSKFHCNDESYLKKLTCDAGFTRPKSQRLDLSFSQRTPEEADNHFTMPANQAILKQFSPEKIEQLKKQLREEYKKALETQVIGVQCLIITAVKP